MSANPIFTYVVTLFSCIPNLAEALLQTTTTASASSVPYKNLKFNVIVDPALSCGVALDPSQLQPTTLESLQQAEILVSEPALVASLLGYNPNALPNLKWCQSTYAGVDLLFLGQNKIYKWKLTRFAGKFGPPMAEWCLARIIGHERKFADTAKDEHKKQWRGSPSVCEYRSLSSLTLSILGCGDIGRCIAQAARTFGMKVVGFTKTARRCNTTGANDNEGIVYTTDLSTALQAGDYIVSVLPSTPLTRNMLGGDALACCVHEDKRSPVLLNVGRGSVIDETFLLEALDKGYLSATILDVFEMEPLPTTSKLWGHPNIVVSPHVSGLTQAKDVPDVFLENFKRYVSGKELLYKVDWSKGY